jgi:hypothetical protein
VASSRPAIALVTRPTRLAGLREKFATLGQARFYLDQARQHQALTDSHRGGRQPQRARRETALRGPRQQKRAGAAGQATPSAATQQTGFEEYQAEDQQFRAALERLGKELDFGLPVIHVDRKYLPTFDFGRCAVVVVLGQDGLVANAAKYVGGLPLVAVNPDPARFDGILLPFTVREARRAVAAVLDGSFQARDVTLAQVELNDGRTMLAFNDFFVGAGSHVSARYVLRVGGRAEPQSSSGVLVSTGAGSTGWFSSVFNMARGVASWRHCAQPEGMRLAWDERRLLWVVREPFASRHSQAGLVAGELQEGDQLVIESIMPEGGVIFSDGIEADAIPFTSGSLARIGVAAQRARLVVG